MKFSITDFFSKCDQIRRKFLKKSAMENFIFCAVEYLIITWLFSYLVRVGNLRYRCSRPEVFCKKNVL